MCIRDSRIAVPSFYRLSRQSVANPFPPATCDREIGICLLYTSVLCSVAGREGERATDQIRTGDKSRIKRKIGELNNREIEELKEVFRQMFCE